MDSVLTEINRRVGHWVSRLPFWFSFFSTGASFGTGQNFTFPWRNSSFPGITFVYIDLRRRTTQPVQRHLHFKCIQTVMVYHYSHQAHWFQYQQFSDLWIFHPSCQCKPAYQSDQSHFTSLWCYFHWCLWPTSDLLHLCIYFLRLFKCCSNSEIRCIVCIALSGIHTARSTAQYCTQCECRFTLGLYESVGVRASGHSYSRAPRKFHTASEHVWVL